MLEGKKVTLKVFMLRIIVDDNFSRKFLKSRNTVYKKHKKTENNNVVETEISSSFLQNSSS